MGHDAAIIVHDKGLKKLLDAFPRFYNEGSGHVHATQGHIRFSGRDECGDMRRNTAVKCLPMFAEGVVFGRHHRAGAG